MVFENVPELLSLSQVSAELSVISILVAIGTIPRAPYKQPKDSCAPGM